MNEWGTPDWRDANGYGDTTAWSLDRWCWEFYRRRDDLRADFDRLLEQAQGEWRCEFIRRRGFEEWKTGSYCAADYEELAAEAEADVAGFHEFQGIAAHLGCAVHPHEPGFAIHADDPFKYGYLLLPNPRIGDQPPAAIRLLPTFRGNPTFCEGHGVPWEKGGEPNASMSIGEGFVGVRFDLDQPLPPQIEAARKALKDWQDQRDDPKKQSRPKRRPFLRYLRILDAIDDGAEDRIVDTILAEEEHCPDPAHAIQQAKALGLKFQF